MQNTIITYIINHLLDFLITELIIIAILTAMTVFFARQMMAYREITLLKFKFGKNDCFATVSDLRDLPKAITAISRVHPFYMKRLGYTHSGENAHEAIVADLIKSYFEDVFFIAIENRLAQAISKEHVVDIKEKIKFAKNKKVYECLFSHDQRILFTTLENGRPLPYQKPQ